MDPTRAEYQRSQSAIGILLELIPVFEADALYTAAESCRRLIGALRVWDLDGAWRHFSAIESASQPWGVLDSGWFRLSDRFVQLASVLRGISLDLLAHSETNAHN